MSAVGGTRRTAFIRQRSRTLEVDTDLISEAAAEVTGSLLTGSHAEPPGISVTKASSKSGRPLHYAFSVKNSGSKSSGGAAASRLSATGHQLLAHPQWWSRPPRHGLYAAAIYTQ